MLTTLNIRAATPADLQTISAFVANLGYTARR
jgi:hypothetical protein